MFACSLIIKQLMFKIDLQEQIINILLNMDTKLLLLCLYIDNETE